MKTIEYLYKKYFELLNNSIDKIKKNLQKENVEIYEISAIDILRNNEYKEVEIEKYLSKIPDRLEFIYSDEIVKLIDRNLCVNVKKLKIPFKILKELNLSNYKNIEELTITDSNIEEIEQIEKVLNKLKLKKAYIESFELSDEFNIKENTIQIDYVNRYIKYKDIELITNSQQNIKSLKILADLEKINSKDLVNSIKEQKIDENTYVILGRNKEFILLNNKEEMHISVKNNKILEYIKAFKELYKNIENIVIVLDNKDYKELEEINNYSKDNSINIKINYSENNYYDISAIATIEEFINMRNTLNYYKSLIPENSSNLEKITIAYDIVKSLPYEDDNNNKKNSRLIHSVIATSKIVCVGYSQLLRQLLKEIGIKSCSYSTIIRDNDDKLKHQRLIVKVEDDKYGIDGLYIFDPTWDSLSKNNKDKDPLKKYNHYMRSLISNKYKNEISPINSVISNQKFSKRFYKILFNQTIITENEKIIRNIIKTLFKEVEYKKALEYIYAEEIKTEILQKVIVSAKMMEGYTEVSNTSICL